jgi:hypothetical protein
MAVAAAQASHTRLMVRPAALDDDECMDLPSLLSFSLCFGLLCFAWLCFFSRGFALIAQLCLNSP